MTCPAPTGGGGAPPAATNHLDVVLHPTPLPPAVRDELDDAPVADVAWRFGRAVRTAVPHRFQLGEVGCG